MLGAAAMMMVVVGCGQGDGESSSASRGACEIANERIDLENSGLACRDAQAIAYLLVGDRKGLQIIRTGAGPWRCRGVPGKDKEMTIRCWQGSKVFSLEPGG